MDNSLVGIQVREGENGRRGGGKDKKIQAQRAV